MEKKILSIIFSICLFGCSTTQNYDKSMLPNADPVILSKVNSRDLITCMQLPVPRPPIPINVDHKIPTKEVYDQNDCIEGKMATKEGRDLKNKRDEENKFNLEIDLEKNEDINLEDQKEE
tara:strand:- start:558 stop:917 length:360 start_codon:yes stop_codon:yes gene_type:complete